jgi:TrmH family RNA methyltransferase
VISRARLKYLRSLRRKKVRAEEGRLLIEGLNVVAEAAAAGRARELFLTDECAASARGAELVSRGLPIVRLAPRDAEALTDTKTPAGVFALVDDPCAELDAAGGAGSGPFGARAFVLVADGVADPGNLGTLIRTAAALGADGVVVTAGSVDPTNPKVVRATAGALFRLPVRRGEAEALAGAGFALYVADAAGESLSTWRERPARFALVVGNEPRGVADPVRALAKGTVAVPLSGRIESLNVAVAAGILLHALVPLPVATP